MIVEQNWIENKKNILSNIRTQISISVFAQLHKIFMNKFSPRWYKIIIIKWCSWELKVFKSNLCIL